MSSNRMIHPGKSAKMPKGFAQHVQAGRITLAPIKPLNVLLWATRKFTGGEQEKAIKSGSCVKCSPMFYGPITRSLPNSVKR